MIFLDSFVVLNILILYDIVCYCILHNSRSNFDISVLILGKCPRKIITITDRTGTIETPRYPKKYKNRQTCVWYIRVKPGYRVKLMVKQRFGIGLEKNITKCLRKDHLVISSRRQGFSDYRQVFE